MAGESRVRSKAEERWCAENSPSNSPDTLYHYTSRLGLLGVLGSKKVWATSSRFLNDTAEFNYAAQLLSAYVDRATPQSAFDEVMHRHFLNFADVGRVALQLFVVSFSANGDSLSQWRAYGNPGNAYAIGFSGLKLHEVCRAQGLALAPCEYFDHDAAFEKVLRQARVAASQAGIDHARLVNYVGLFSGKGDIDSEVGDWYLQLQLSMIRCCILCKHPSFAEEEEWRAIRLGSGDRRFRPGKSYLIPYVEVDLSSLCYSGLIDEVVIGPTPAPLADEESLKWFLNEQVAPDPKIRLSGSPFRSW